MGRKENSANRTKRGFDFNSAVRIFAGTVREYVDPRPWNDQRIVATGQVEGRFITIVYTRRNNVYRIISARVARSKERFVITRKTLEQAEAERGFADLTKIDRTSDSEIEQQIAEDPDLASPTEALPELLRVRDVRRRLGLTQRQFSEKLSIPISMVRDWERRESPTDPAIQTLLRILDRIPEPALRAQEEVQTG